MNLKTTIRNGTKKAVGIYDRAGNALTLLMPGSWIELTYHNRLGLYAPWQEVIYGEDKVEQKPNPDYPVPKSKWRLTVLNVDGRDLERRLIGGVEVVLPRGLERAFELAADDPLSMYSRLEIRWGVDRFASTQYPGYNAFKDALKDILIDRPLAELEEIKLELDRLLEAI